MPRKLLVLLGFCLFSHLALAETCVDIRDFDLANATIQVGNEDANKLRTLFNGPDPDIGPFSMKNGVATIPDPPDPEFPDPDWKAELIVNRLIHPDSATWVRVIILENVHLRGTGTFRYVMAFSCQRGHLIRLFQFSSECVTLKHLDSAHLQLYQAIWQTRDAHCCPSSHRELSYTWNPQSHRYHLLRASSPSIGAKFTPDEK